MRERKTRGGAHGEGLGAKGARAGGGPSWAKPTRAELGRVEVKSPRHAQPQIGIQSQNEIRNETKQTRD
jgi:hypothetical protein